MGVGVAIFLGSALGNFTTNFFGAGSGSVLAVSRIPSLGAESAASGIATYSLSTTSASETLAVDFDLITAATGVLPSVLDAADVALETFACWVRVVATFLGAGLSAGIAASLACSCSGFTTSAVSTSISWSVDTFVSTSSPVDSPTSEKRSESSPVAAAISSARSIRLRCFVGSISTSSMAEVAASSRTATVSVLAVVTKVGLRSNASVILTSAWLIQSAGDEKCALIQKAAAITHAARNSFPPYPLVRRASTTGRLRATIPTGRCA